MNAEKEILHSKLERIEIENKRLKEELDFSNEV
jgi:hypothetical protein